MKPKKYFMSIIRAYQYHNNFSIFRSGCHHIWDKQQGIEYVTCLKCGLTRSVFFDCQHYVMQQSSLNHIGIQECTKCGCIDYSTWVPEACRYF